MASKNPAHKGKIPWAMAVRNFGEERARQLVQEGTVAPNPNDERYGNALTFLNEARAAVQAVSQRMNEAGIKGFLRVGYHEHEPVRKPKKKAAEQPKKK